MGKIKRLEDFNVWKEARSFGIWSNQIIKNFPQEEKWLLRKHIFENNRHAPANIAEGFYRFHYKEKVHFYDIALGCLGELKNDYYVAFDREYIDLEILKKAIAWLEKIIRMLNSVIKNTYSMLHKDKN